ncbi:metal-dependent hydrolase [Paenibacillus sp. TAF58]
MLSYASHSFIDLFNDRGVELFWPIPFKFRLLPKWIAIDTGSVSETVFRSMLLLLSLVIPFWTYVLPQILSHNAMF